MCVHIGVIRRTGKKEEETKGRKKEGREENLMMLHDSVNTSLLKVYPVVHSKWWRQDFNSSYDLFTQPLTISSKSCCQWSLPGVRVCRSLASC